MILKILFSKNYWRYNFSLVNAAKSFFGVLGVFYLLFKVISIFYIETEDLIKPYFWHLIIICLIYMVYNNRPRLKVSYRLNNKDIFIEICVCDIFKCKGSYVIGSNTTFETSMDDNLIASSSIQGLFTKKFYDNIGHLDRDIDISLTDEPFTPLDNSVGKRKNKKYDVGTVAKISTSSQKAYFLAIASINEHGIASSTFEDLKNSLARLWDFVSNRGWLEPIVIPVLGSGYSRLKEDRSSIIKEIIKSFIAACATRKFTDKLTVVIHPKDYYCFDINLFELSEFLKYQCLYTEFSDTKNMGGGTAIN